MSNTENIKRVRIYLNERDSTAGQPLYLATLERLRREGATGATALRGVAGFGAGLQLHAATLGDFTAAPIVIEWVDRAERVGRILPLLDELLSAALITIEDLRVYRAVLRSGGPFGDRTVGQVMLRAPATARPDLTVRAAAELMLARDQPWLPILDERGGILGMLSADDLPLRAGLSLPLRLFPALSAAEQQAVLEQLPARPAGEIMIVDPRTAYVESSIAQALGPMIEWGIDALPVLDRSGQLVGLFGGEQALRAAQRAPTSTAGPVRDAEPPTPVSLVMQRSVPSIAAAAPLEAVIPQLLAAPERFVVVIEDGRPIGTISDLRLAQRLAEPARTAWLAALRTPAAPPAMPPESDRAGAAGALADRDTPTIGAPAPQDEAIRLMLEGGYERLLVLEDDGRLAGVVSRRAIVRGLAQAAG